MKIEIKTIKNRKKWTNKNLKDAIKNDNKCIKNMKIEKIRRKHTKKRKRQSEVSKN